MAKTRQCCDRWTYNDHFGNCGNSPFFLNILTLTGGISIKINIGGPKIISNICINESDTMLVARPLPRYFPEMTYGILTKKGRYLGRPVKDFIKIAKDYYNK